MTDATVDVDALRDQVREKYREAADDPHRSFPFHTGRPLAARLGYDRAAVEALPDRAVESFAGVGNPFSLRTLGVGERVVDRRRRRVRHAGESRARRSRRTRASHVRGMPNSSPSSSVRAMLSRNPASASLTARRFSASNSGIPSSLAWND